MFVTPITLAIFYSFFDLQIDRIGFLRVIQQVFEVQFIPLTIGLFIQKFIPQVASIISQPLILIADFLFLLLIALAIVPSFLLIESMNIQSQIVILIMVVISLSIGHFLGGSEVEKRATLAIACIARNIGLAIYIAILNDAQKEVIPTLISYAIWGALIAIPYSFWSKRQIAK
ncbi:MAG: hypothetical protein ACFBSE_17295 [Prochloraceae cyanobacterium]